MRNEALTHQQVLNANTLLDTLKQRRQLKNDAALSRDLEVSPPVVSKIRSGAQPVGNSLLIRAHDLGMGLDESRAILAHNPHAQQTPAG